MQGLSVSFCSRRVETPVYNKEYMLKRQKTLELSLLRLILHRPGKLRHHHGGSFTRSSIVAQGALAWGLSCVLHRPVVRQPITHTRSQRKTSNRCD